MQTQQDIISYHSSLRLNNTNTSVVLKEIAYFVCDISPNMLFVNLGLLVFICKNVIFSIFRRAQVGTNELLST